MFWQLDPKVPVGEATIGIVKDALELSGAIEQFSSDSAKDESIATFRLVETELVVAFV